MTATLDSTSYTPFVLPARYAPNITRPLVIKATARLNSIFLNHRLDYPHATILKEWQVRSAWCSTPAALREGYILKTWPSNSFGSYFKILLK